jgi:membrane protease YdiL (CAAX protease family)
MEFDERSGTQVEFVSSTPAPVQGPPTKNQRIWRFAKEMIGIALLLAVSYGVVLGIFYLNGSLDAFSALWFYVIWYPLLLVVLLVWVKVVQRQDLRPFLLGRPHWPAKGHRWFYIAYVVLWGAAICILVVLINLNLAILPVITLVLVVTLLHSCVGAPIVEEMVFRGYVYGRAETAWGQARFFTMWNREVPNEATGAMDVKPVMTFELTYAAIISSLIFGIYHMNPLQSVYTFFGGWIFCKTRNEWGKTLTAPMAFHASWNFLVGIISVLTFPFLTSLINKLFGGG